MTFPTLWSVGTHAYSAGDDDGYGGTGETFTPNKDQPGTLQPVICWGPAGVAGRSAEPKMAGHDRVVVDLELLVPPEFTVGPYDLVDIPEGPQAGQYEVIGYPEDLTHGPFGYRPGYVVNLRKVEG